MSFYYLKTLVKCFINFFSYFVLIWLIQIYSQLPMIYYDYYHISNSDNFNMKLNYIFNNMEH